MTWVAAAIGGSALLGYMGSQQQAGAATSAARMQADAANQAAAQQMQMFNTINQQQAPYREAGYGALTKIQDMLPYLTKQVTAEDLNAMPGYKFGLEQGVGATGQALNVGGGGSNVTRGVQKFAEDYATNTGLPMYLKQRESIYNTLAGIAGIGQAGQSQVNTAGQNITSNIGQLGVGAAGALGAGSVGAANAMAGGLQGFGNAATLASLLRPQTPAATGGISTMPASLALG
jgi:hypothetical protein